MPSAVEGRVLVASGNPYAASPSWERIDMLGNCRCPGFDIATGRSTILERTDMGTARVYFNDRDLVLDTDDLVGQAILLQAYNPVLDTWEEQFRGVVDEPNFDVHNSGVKATVSLDCVDMFAWLALIELRPGVGMGFTGGKPGQIFYENGNVDDRLIKLFEDAGMVGLSGIMFIIFTGNVSVHESSYDAGESILNPIREAVEAEFPGIANLYIDRKGRAVFHGRFARFDPVGVSTAGANWDYEEWKGGDGAAIALDSSRAQVREFSHSRPAARIYNSAMAWPRYDVRGFPLPEANKAALVWEDATSRIKYGRRALPAMADLIIKENINNGNTGEQECLLFAKYFVENLKAPHKHIKTVTFKAVHPDDPRAPATWDFMTRADISDSLNLSVAAGGVNNELFYIEGFQKTVRVLNPQFDYMEVTPNLSPASLYATNVFED